jgi:hypothetical protein
MSQLEQRLLVVKKVQEGREGRRRPMKVDLSRLEQRLLAVKKVEEGREGRRMWICLGSNKDFLL